MSIFRKHFWKKDLLFYRSKWKLLHPGRNNLLYKCSLENSSRKEFRGYTNREVEDESTVDDCSGRAKKTTHFGLYEKKYSIAEVIITQLKYCMWLWELHFIKKKKCGLLGKDPEGGTAGSAKHVPCRVMLRYGCKDKGSCIFSKSRVDKHNGLW